MNAKQFVDMMKEILGLETELSMETRFRELEEWDSLAYLSTIAMIDDEYDIVINANEFKELETIGDIIQTISKKQ